MNANDPADENEAQGAEIPEAGAAGGAGSSKDGAVSQTATTEGRHGTEGSGKSQTASQQTQKVRADQTEKTGIAGTIQFVSEALVELRKITWPDRQQVVKETLSVIVLVAIITACVLAFDYGIAKAVFEPLDKLARHLGGGIGVHH